MPEAEKIRIGCSGWSYKDWVGPFYPSDAEAKDYLKLYSTTFDCVEIDSSFYRIPSPSMVSHWKGSTPDGFTFSPKLSKKITHENKLENFESTLLYFYSVLGKLGDKLGPIVVQLPPSVKLDKHKAVMEKFVSSLEPRFKHAIEFRHKSWFTPETYRLLEKNNVAMAWSINQYLETPPEVTADFVYLRMVGTREITKFDGIQKEMREEMDRWATALKEKAASLKDDSYVFFNNHFAGFGPESVNEFRRLLGMIELQLEPEPRGGVEPSHAAVTWSPSSECRKGRRGSSSTSTWTRSMSLVEVRENPKLKGLPVVVGADPEGGKGRGVVMTSSYEARKFGLKSGMPISMAFRLCPGAVYLPPHWELYEDVSRRVMKLLRGHADKFEQLGIDEAFLDVSGKARDVDEAKRLAISIKKELRDSLGLTCSIGIAPNKSLAKIASDRQKPNGLTVVPFEDPKGFLAPLHVSVIPGVGSKTQAFLKEHEIETIGQLQQVSGQQLLKWFGKTGVWLWGVIQAEEMLPVIGREMPKSLSAERTFKEDTEDFRKVYDEAADAARELGGRVREANLLFKVAGVKIRFKGFETHTRERTLVGYTDSDEVLLGEARSLLKEFEFKKRPVRLVGVRVSQLRRETAELTRLDEWAQG